MTSHDNIYSATSAESRFPTSQHALILVDFQKGFDAPYWGRRNNPLAEQNALRLLRHWRAAQAPVVIVRHDSTEGDSSLRPHQPGNQLKPGFEPIEGELLCPKHVHSAFIGTSLLAWLKERNISDITIAGITTDMCTSTTTRMGANLGFRMSLVEDACACFEQRDQNGDPVEPELIHHVHITTLGSDFARIINTDSIVGKV